MGAGDILENIVKDITAVVELPGDLVPGRLYVHMCKQTGEGLLERETWEALHGGFGTLLRNESL